MKDEQQKKLANAITRVLNKIDPEHAVQNASAGSYLAQAVNALCVDVPYYEEATVDMLATALGALNEALPLASDAEFFGPPPKTVEALT